LIAGFWQEGMDEGRIFEVGVTSKYNAVKIERGEISKWNFCLRVL